ncbi:hypothetical protein GQ85_31725, partial [Rhodococcus rhodochrous]
MAGGGGGAVLGEQLHEAVEQVEGVVGAGRGLRVELHGEGGPVEQAQALDDLVVQGPVGDLDAAEARLRRLDRLAEGGVHGEAVVLGGDGHAARGLDQHRLVRAAVAELQLVGVEAERAAEDLVAEADAEERQAGVEDLAQQLHLGVCRGRVAGAVGQEDAVRVHGADAGQVRGRGQHVHADAAGGQVPRRGGLDAEVEGGDLGDRLALPAVLGRLDDVR